MKIAIHHNLGSFSDLWIKYCEDNQIPYKIVNCYDNDIVKYLEDCSALIWHHSHSNYKDALFAKQLLYSLEQSGKKVFPDFNTSWHFDDKVGQKYLLESIQAPFVPTYVFYTKKEALEWTDATIFPKVFKLRNGAGSSNVKLIKNKKKAISVINKAFGRGFRHNDYLGLSLDSFKKLLKGRAAFRDIIKYLALFFLPSKFGVNFFSNSKGYVYFQDFIPNNKFDIRIIVISSKAFAIQRMVRENDFRASGSGQIIYEQNEIPIQCVQIALNISKKLNIQCMAYDFVFTQSNFPLIVEMSYGFTAVGYDKCTGYWSDDFVWHQGQFNPYGWMVEYLTN